MKTARKVVFALLVLTVATIVGVLLWVRRDLSQTYAVIQDAQNRLPERAVKAVIAVEDPRFPTRHSLNTATRLERAVVAACSRWRICGPLATASLTEQITRWQIEGRPISRLSRVLVVSTIIEF